MYISDYEYLLTDIAVNGLNVISCLNSSFDNYTKSM